jgi:hypothetical protein
VDLDEIKKTRWIEYELKSTQEIDILKIYKELKDLDQNFPFFFQNSYENNIHATSLFIKTSLKIYYNDLYVKLNSILDHRVYPSVEINEFAVFAPNGANANLLDSIFPQLCELACSRRLEIEDEDENYLYALTILISVLKTLGINKQQRFNFFDFAFSYSIGFLKFQDSPDYKTELKSQFEANFQTMGDFGDFLNYVDQLIEEKELSTAVDSLIENNELVLNEIFNDPIAFKWIVDYKTHPEGIDKSWPVAVRICEMIFNQFKFSYIFVLNSFYSLKESYKAC